MLDSTQNRQTGVIHTLGTRLQRKMHTLKPTLPIINADSNASGRGILEKSGNGPASEVLSATRSVHFSPETTRHSRGFVMDVFNREATGSPNLMDESINAPVRETLHPSARPDQRNARPTSEGEHSADGGQIRYSRLGRRGTRLDYLS